MILAMMKIVMLVVTVLMMMSETAQTRAIMMKSNLNPLYLKNFFYMIVMMS